MIQYDPKDLWHLVSALHGTVLPRIWKRVLLLAGLTAAVTFAHARGWVTLEINSLGHSIMGVVLGLLLVFRTNLSYDRYWEGRKLWNGLLTATRNLVRGAAAYAAPAGELARLAVAYAVAVRHRLRGEPGENPLVVALDISRWIDGRQQARTMESGVARQLESHVSALTDCLGHCERIRQTPMPFVYAVHGRHLLLLYLATLPFVLVPVMGWIAPLGVGLIAFGLLGIEAAGLEIENPFGEDANDLPLDEFCADIARDAAAVAGENRGERQAA
ncbi:MAG: bestrophin family protein [Gemmataceae bacterium]